MSEAKKAILVGRHAPTDLHFTVVEQRNVTFADNMKDVKKQVEELIAAAFEADAVLLFQNIPGALGAALTSIAMRNAPTHVGVGVIISKPAPRGAGVTINADHSVFADEMTADNITDYLSHVLKQANPNVKVADDGSFYVDPTMKFEFSHIEWLFS